MVNSPWTMGKILLYLTYHPLTLTFDYGLSTMDYGLKATDLRSLFPIKPVSITIFPRGAIVLHITKHII
jgi:hypothetical protein